MNLYHVTKSSPYFPFTLYCLYTRISSSMPVLTTGIVWYCFYLLIFYSEKFSTWVWFLQFVVNVNLNPSIVATFDFTRNGCMLTLTSDSVASLKWLESSDKKGAEFSPFPSRPTPPRPHHPSHLRQTKYFLFWRVLKKCYFIKTWIYTCFRSLLNMGIPKDLK